MPRIGLPGVGTQADLLRAGVVAEGRHARLCKEVSPSLPGGSGQGMAPAHHSGETIGSGRVPQGVIWPCRGAPRGSLP